MAVICTCACCGSPAVGDREWGWCAECAAAGCIRLKSDAEGGDVRRGIACPLLRPQNRPAAQFAVHLDRLTRNGDS